jgi:hypothetical protein
MEVNMKNGLPGSRPIIHDQSVSIRVEFVPFRNGPRSIEKVPDELTVRRSHALNIRDMFFGNDEDVGRGLRVEVFEREAQLILMNDFSGNLLRNDFAKNTGRIHVHHASLFGSEASVKTGPFAGVARGACSIDLDQKRVLVAIVQNFMHALHIAGGLALLPELLAGTAPEPGDFGLHGFA